MPWPRDWSPSQPELGAVGAKDRTASWGKAICCGTAPRRLAAHLVGLKMAAPTQQWVVADLPAKYSTPTQTPCRCKERGARQPVGYQHQLPGQATAAPAELGCCHLPRNPVRRRTGSTGLRELFWSKHVCGAAGSSSEFSVLLHCFKNKCSAMPRGPF